MAPVDYTPPANPYVFSEQATSAQALQRETGRPWQRYTVRPGDSLAKLAVRHQTTIKALVAKNKLENPRLLRIGTTIQVPGEMPKRSAAPEPKAKKKASDRSKAKKEAKDKAPARRTLSHTVRRNDNLISLARYYDTSWGSIMKANRLADPHRITVGQKLQVPVPASFRGDGDQARSPKKDHKHDSKKKDTKKSDKRDDRRGEKKDDKKKESRTFKPSSRNTFLGRTYPDHVVRSAERNRAALKEVDVPSRSETRSLIVSTARRYGVDPKLALAISWQESGWNQRAVSVANAVGIMQVMPGTGEWCSGLAGRELNLMNPKDNVVAGVVYLRWLAQNASSTDQAIAGYYQGLGGVRKNGMYPDTKSYVRAVKAHMARF